MMDSFIEIFDLEKGESVLWKIFFPFFSDIYDLEEAEKIFLEQAVLEDLKTSREIMDEIDKEFG